MAGDGEGLVAIVQGLDPAGVTLTVCNRSRHTSDRRRCSRPRIQINAGNTRTDMPPADLRSLTLPANSAPLANQRSSAETSTGTDFSRQHTSSQICDGRYASSYKLAHCMVTPTSPPEAVSEFPPQRKEPCRNQGNFEIGGHGSGQWNCHGSGQGSGHSSGKVRVSASRVRHYGGSQTWVEKGSSHRYCKSNRETEAFAHSLRKYPSMAPFRTASTDLIEKLIRYTQAKNFQELSRTTKSMRSLRQQKSSDTHDVAKASKHQQTYTRRRDENVTNTNVQVGSRGRTRNFKLYSPVSDSRNLKVSGQRDATFSSSYDYLKAANSPYERPNHSDKSPSPTGSSSPERTRSPEGFRSPVRFKSIDRFRSPDRPNRLDRSIRFKRSVRDLSLSDMSKYIRSTIRQICNERPVVFQMCPELKNRFDQHRQICSNRTDRPSDDKDDEPEEDQASGSVLSRLIQSFSRCAEPSTEQAGCQCTKTNCYCSKATQCANKPDASTNTITCSCKTPTKSRCCRGMPCACTNKVQDQAYYNKRIDEEISEWLKEVPVHSIECSDSKKKRDTVIKELRKTLKLLPDDENFGDNARNEIKSFVDDFPLWNPGKDKKDEQLFKNQLADKLTERIVNIPRKPNRFRDIVKKWVVDMDFDDDGEDVDKEAIIDKFVDKLKSLAAERPACDIKYTHILRKEIIELLVELALKSDGDMVMLKKLANKLTTEIVSIPRNVNLSGDMTDLTDEFEENLSDWICEHGLCGELKKDPKLIEGLAKKLNKLKSQGIDDECVIEKMKAEIHQFVGDVGIVIETMDELIDELMKQLSNTVQTNEMDRLDQDEVVEISTYWLSNLPGCSDLDPRKFEKIVKGLVNMIIEGREQGNEDLANDILNYLVEVDLSIDPADLAIYVEELMEKLNMLPSQKYHKEQVKKAMLKDIFDIIENLSMPQNKKEVLRSKAHEILENHLNNLDLNSKDDHDNVMEGIMDDMDDFISTINLPKESRCILKNSLSRKLSSNFGKSYMRLKRLSGDGSNLKQTIAKDVRNAVKELPIDPDKKKDLMQQVKGTLSKSMHKPLPSNVKNTINDEISDIVERCPISKDRSIVGSLKKILSAVASKHLNICLPKCVCDIQSKVEKDVGIVIDKSSIDTRVKKQLKKSIQDILAENEDRNLSDEVLRTIKKDINGVVSDLSIPQDKKDVLKQTVSETISKDFNDALPNLRHDLNKVRNKLFEDICNAIEKSPIPRIGKTHLINKLKSVLARNLDSSLSDEEKYTILDDVSNIVKDDMPVEKRISLTNKLAKKLDTQQRKEDTKEIDQVTKNLKELEHKILDYILREMEHAIEASPISSERKIELKRKLKDIATIDYKKPAEDIAEELLDCINEILDELNLPKDKTNEMKNELAAAIDEYSKMLSQINDVETEYGRHNQQIGKGLMPIEEFDENKAKESILQGIEDIIEQSVIPEEKKTELKRNLKKMATDHMKKPFSDDVQDAIKMGIADILDELQIPKSEKNKLKRELIKMTDDYLDNLREAKQPAEEFDEPTARQNILQGIEKIIDESAIPEEKKMEMKRKLKTMATENLKKPFSDDVQDAIKMGIADILDELQIPKSEKNQLKRELMKMTDDYLDDLREAKQPAEEFNEPKAKGNILQGIEKIIDESAIPEEKKMELKRKLKKMATVNLKKPFSDDVQDAIKMGIADILDELQIPKSEKNQLKRELMKMTDDYLDDLREAKQPAEEFDEPKARQNILQGIEEIIEESAIPEEKKIEMKKKLKKMATDNLKKPFSDDVQDAIKMGIADILDELQIPKSEKNRLKSELIKMTDDYLDNLQEAEQPAKEFDEPTARQNILQGIAKIIDESAIPEEKKMEMKRKLKTMATENLKKPFSDDVQDAIKMGIADILDELQIPKSEKNQLKRELMKMTDDYLDDLREAKQPAEEFNEPKAKGNILQGIEKIIDESAIPEEKKMELKRKLKKMATVNLKKPFSDDVQDAIKMGIADILAELQIPKSEKNQLKRELMKMTDDYLDDLREAKQPAEEFDEPKARQNILQGIEEIIEESAIPEEKKIEMKRKLKKMATDNLKKPFSDDVQDAIKMGIADILDELQIPKSEKNRLKRELIKMTDDYLDNLREAKQPAEEFDEPKARQNILQGIEEIIEDSAIPEEKKIEMKRKLRKIATDNLKKPFSDDVQDAIKMGIADILDELQIPKSEKKKLKRELIKMTDDYLDNLQEAEQPAKEFDEPKARQHVLQGIEKIFEESAIPEEKKIEMKRKLKKMATDNLKKPFSDDVQDAIKMGIADELAVMQIPKSEKKKLRRELMKMSDEFLDNLQAKQPVEEVDEPKAKENILQGIEKILDDSAIPEEKKMEMKRKLKKMATDNFKKPFSDDVQDAIKMGIADELAGLQIPKSEKKKMKRELIKMTDDYLDNLRKPRQVRSSKSLMPVAEVDETNAKESILQGIEKIIEESAIPENKKMELKRKLKKMATDNLKKPFNNDVPDAMMMGIADILDELQIPSSEKNKLKRALVNMVDENVDNLRGVSPKLASQVDDFKELESESQSDILLGLQKTIDEAPIQLDKRREFKKKLKDLASKNFQKPLSDDTAEAFKDRKKERKQEINSEKSMPDEKRNKLNIIIRRVLPQFEESVDPSYQKQLAEDFDELLEIAVTDGDFKDARRRLIKKLMREQNLSEKEASAPVDELIGRAREMALKEDIDDERYELDPKYVKKLEPDIKELVDIALVGGDFEDARRKLTKKLMREQNLPEEKASVCADDLIGKAQKLALAAQSKDKSQLFKEALAKAISDAVDQTSMSKPDKSNLKNKLLSKLKQTLDKKPFINKDDLEPLKSQILKDLKKIVDESSIPTDKKNELKSLMNEDLANTIDEIMDDYDVEEGYTKSYTKAISKAVNKSPIPNLEKCSLKKDLAKTFDGILDDFDDKITKHKEAFARAIDDAVDQSTLSKPDKSSLKNKLLNKMKQTVDESPNINDTGALKAEVLKDCKNVVDDSSIPIGKKSELKLLLKEEIMDDYDDEETFAMDRSPEYEDKLKKYQEAFARAINDAVDESTLSKPDKSSQKNKLLSKLNQIMDNSPHLNDMGALIGEVLKESKNVVDDSSIPIGKKSELKSLLQEALAGTAKELMDDSDDEETFAKEESQEHEDKLKKYKEAFARAINGAVDQSSLSKPDKNGQKNKLLSKLNQTIDNSPNLNDIGALIDEILKDSKKVVDTSSIPIEKKNELKLLLQEAMAGAAKVLMDDEEVSREAFTMFQDKIAETVKTWMDSLPIDLDPNVTTAVAKDIASDILDRLKYLQLHPKAITTDKDEIENLKYQIFRRMKNIVDSKDIPPIMEGTEELYRMIMEIEPPPGFPKLRREQSTSERRRRDPVTQERKKSTSSEFSTGNINHSLKNLIATSRSMRRQWSRNIDEAVTKLPLPRNKKCFLKEKLAIYDETGQSNIMSTKRKTKEETSAVQGTKLKKQVAPKPAHVATKPAHVVPKTAQKNNKGKLSSRLSKIDKALTFNNTTKQKSPFNPNPNQGVDEKQFTKFTTDTIKAWLERIQVNIEPGAKKRIIGELTNDVVDRKKYLQVYGSAEPTRTDDLDYLKLQVHRRLNAFVPAEALKAVIVDTNVLLAKIDTVTMKTTPVSQKTGNKEGIADILDNNRKATNTSNGDLNETDQELSNTEFSPPKTSTPGKSNEEPTPEEYKNKVAESIKTWIGSVPIDLAPEAETGFIEQLTNDIVDRKRYLQVQPDKMISKKEEIENLRFQVFKRLISANPDASETPDIEMVEDLYKMIGDGRRKSLSPKQAEEFRTALNAEISAILDDYNICCDRRELHPSLANELTKLAKSNPDQDEIVENLIDSIKRLTYLSPCLCDEEAEELAHKLLYKAKKLIARIQERDRRIAAGTAVKKKDFKEAVMNDIGDVFDGCPLSNEKRTLMENQLAEDYAKDLGIPLEDSDVTMNETGPESKKGDYGMSFNGLTNYIDTWLSSINTDDDTKGEDEIKDMKKDMAYSLIHKIGEMNVDPEIFNDDSLYEAILRDELQNLLGDITMSDDEIQALKEDLIEKVLEAQHRAHDEIAGQIYKKNLRDTISKLLPDQRNLSKEEQDGMETLKDQLADAYIDLHYSGGNEIQRERAKKKITDEINNFCRDYLYRNPCSPLNSRTLNQNLYNALNKVPLPTGDSIRYEVEQARIREEINDWIKELPLQPQNPTEVLARNKLVYLLSKKLFDIEVEGDDTDNELMKKEIVKFLNKIPLESGEDKDTLADKLIDKLKATQVSRKYDASSNVTLDAFGNVSAGSNGSCMDAPICRPYKPLASSPQVCRRPCPKQPKPFPPCTLSPEDRAHLERIKRRTCLSPNCLSTFMRNNKCNTGVGSRPVDAGSQTVLRPFGMESQQSPICSVNNERPRPCPGLSANLAHPPCSHTRRDPFEIEKPPPSPICPAAHENTSRPCPGPLRPSLQNGHQMRRHTISSGHIESPIEEEVQPQIIIKQYYWNPNEKTSIVDSDLQQSGRSSNRQSNPTPCHQPGHQIGSAPCDQTRTSSYAQSTSAPCPHSSFGKLQQQNTSPQRMPCDQSFMSPEPKSQQQPSPEHYSYWDPQSSFQGPSQRDLPSGESSFTPSPCMSPFGLNQQPSPPCSPSFSKREHEYRLPKRDGLQDQMPCSSRPCRKERVIELGSLDDVPNARPKKRHSDQSDWPYTKFQEDDNFWGVPMRRVILDEGINESVVMEREQREERIRCRCKERLIPKNGRSQPRTCSSQDIPKSGRSQARTCPSQEISQGTADEQNLKKCSKCCGRHCPYPSFLYFRQ